MRIFLANSPQDPSEDPGWAWVHACSDDQRCAILQDADGRWPVSWEGGSWHNKGRARQGGGQGSLTGLLSAW